MWVQVRTRVRQIDCVTVKGSQQPMGLFTYDVSLERVPTPSQGNLPAFDAPAPNYRESRMSTYSGSDARSRNAPGLLDDDLVSYSMSTYNWEYSDHPDLACTWAVDEAFLDLFAQARPPAYHDVPYHDVGASSVLCAAQPPEAACGASCSVC